ncbi:diguanylate cyclase domain-containing protein [Undibacterium sp. Ji67W]|uniref:diguanylate cyclase domain-containing protein n=1 Tax=Undibacterium sp. Ji67W TaxID=3413042 RepID=UPI003BF0D3AE
MENNHLRSPISPSIFRQHLIVLSLAMSAALLLSTFIAGSLVYKQMRSELLLKSVMLGSNLSDRLIAGDTRGMQNLVLNTASDHEILTITLYDYKGHPILSSANGSLVNTDNYPDSVVEPSSRFNFYPGNILISTPITDNSGVRGQLIVQSRTVPLYRQIFQLFICFLAGFIVITIVTAYILTKKQIRLLQPALSLADVAEKVASTGDYSLRASLEKTGDLSNLSMYFNLMLARMEAWEADMHSEAHERREAESRLSILENHDSLTKLPNRHFFHRLLTNNLEDAIANHEMMALMFIDLDHFKNISESYGYDACDQILTIMAQRLSEVLRSTDTLCRVDADEFAAVLPRVEKLDTVKNLAERLVAAIQKPLTLDGKHFIVTGSIGIACCPLHAVDQRVFLHLADVALKAAKQAGRNTWCLYDANSMGDADLIL